MKTLSRKRIIASIFCNWSPPIISQRIRNCFYSESDGILESVDFIKKSITGSTFKGNTRDIHAYAFSVHGYYDWRLIAIAESLFRKGDEIIEIGANIGTETICFSDIVGEQGRVFAFEPFPMNVEILMANANSSRNKNISIYDVAICDRDSILEFNPPPNSHMTGIGTINLTGTAAAQSLKVNSFKLDSFQEIFRKIGGIFIDIEGSDLLAIQGAKLVIDKFKPVIVFEYSPKLMKKFGLSQREVMVELDEMNYIPYKIGKFFLQKVQKDEAKKSNWICFPLNDQKVLNKINFRLLYFGLLPPIFHQKYAK